MYCLRCQVPVRVLRLLPEVLFHKVCQAGLDVRKTRFQTGEELPNLVTRSFCRSTILRLLSHVPGNLVAISSLIVVYDL
jgi:hypothetical protein